MTEEPEKVIKYLRYSQNSSDGTPGTCQEQKLNLHAVFLSDDIKFYHL